MSEQIWGLSRALKSIHLCRMNHKDNPQGLPEETYRKIHGRHGDLKPENILWFRSIKNSRGDQSMHVLQIADFGFAEFHGPNSKSNVRVSRIPGFTDSYKAPEAEGSKRVSQQYDIWSLGCILSQFVIWWMWGWEGIDAFSKRRADEGFDVNIPIRADTFYNIDHGRKRIITLKETVIKVRGSNEINESRLIIHRSSPGSRPTQRVAITYLILFKSLNGI